MFFSTFHVLQITLLRVLYNTKKNSLFHSRSKQRLATSCTNHREDLEQGCLVCPHLPDRRTGAAILKGHRSLVKTPPPPPISLDFPFILGTEPETMATHLFPYSTGYLLRLGGKRKKDSYRRTFTVRACG